MKFNARENMFNDRDGGGVPWIVTMRNAGVEYSVCGAASEAEAINLRDRFEACLPGAPVPPSDLETINANLRRQVDEARKSAPVPAPEIVDESHDEGCECRTSRKETAVCNCDESAPVPAPRLEWTERERAGIHSWIAGPWQIQERYNSNLPSRKLDGYALRLSPRRHGGDGAWIAHSDVGPLLSSVDAAKSLAEKLNAVLAPPVGPQE